jgi:hypothetical protein
MENEIKEETKMETNGWEEVRGTSAIWTPEKAGDSIEGTIKEIKMGQYGLQAVITNGDKTWTTPSHKVLQNRLADCKVGEYIKITFEKEELPTVKGRQGTNIYSIKRKVSVIA